MGDLRSYETVGEDSKDASELLDILKGEDFNELLIAHDMVGQIFQFYSNLTSRAAGSTLEDSPPPELEQGIRERLGRYSEPNIKIVRIEKTNEPLGATVKNEDDAVIVGRIIRGGTAEATGVLHEGDEIIEVNDVPLRGRNVNDVCDTLASMQGTLTLLIVPGAVSRALEAAKKAGSSSANNGSSVEQLMNKSSMLGTQQQQQPVMHVKAHIDYDPEDDPYVPCRELGISFVKGDILHVINQKDPHWWQARREGEDDQQLPGLIPSASFQQQREAVKQTIAQDSMRQESDGGAKMPGGRGNTGFLCAKKSGRSKKRRKPASYLPDEDTENELDEIITYEEVALYYPQSERKRPVVLIGPPNIGRHELRQRLMQNVDRFAAAIPRELMIH